MNRRSKVIVSIVGITIVLLALLGITYAYYLTRIEGNTNTNSISITTADLKLEYGDGSVNILTKENIIPDNNNPIGTKDFTVTNTGNTTIYNYSVVLEYAVLEDIKPSVFKYPNDFEINLTCIDNEGNECNTAKINFNNESVTLTTANIDPNETHNYTLTIYYLETGIDQSDDMGKNLNLKIQIYEVKETADIKGTITGINEDYSITLNSNPKVSTIVKNSDGSYRYSFSGVEIGTHTISVLNKDGEEVSNEKIVIQKGDEVGFSTTEVDGTNVLLITINESNRVINLRTNVTNNTVTNSEVGIDIFNPYEGSKDSLAYNIINVAKNITQEQNLNGNARFSLNPITKPGKTFSGIRYISEGEVQSLNSVEIDFFGDYYIYGDNYTFDEESGTYSLTNVKVCKYIECYKDLEGKYIPISFDSSINVARYNNLNYKTEGLLEIAKIETTNSSGFSYALKSNANFEMINESTLSLTIDDYGTSYYYRGDVNNNFVNFAGMCWRIVRINGRGGVKLSLADEYNECNSSNSSLDNLTSAFINNGLVYQYSLDDSDDSLTYTNTEIPDLLNTWAINNNIDLNYLEDAEWCFDFSKSNKFREHGVVSLYQMYGPLSRIYNTNNANPTLKCNILGVDNTSSIKFNDKLGILSLDEWVYAGLTFNPNNDIYNNYLFDNLGDTDYAVLILGIDDVSTKKPLSLYRNIVGHFSPPPAFAESFLINPVIVLNNSVKVIVDSNSEYIIGTKENPYVIK